MMEGGGISKRPEKPNGVLIDVRTTMNLDPQTLERASPATVKHS